MDIPAPQPGQVIRYAYLWADEHAVGRDEGSKIRPAALIVAKKEDDETTTVIAVPITHTPPLNLDEAIEIPPETKRRLGLDDQPSWIVVSETNVFRWSGPDVRPVPRKTPATILYGVLPRSLFVSVRKRLLEVNRDGRLRQVRRTE